MDSATRSLRQRSDPPVISKLNGKATALTNAERCKAYRMRMKEDKLKYEQVREADRKRCQANRTKKMTEEELAQSRALAAARAKKYRAKKKAEQASVSQPKANFLKTRKAKDEQRKKWREQKAKQRSEWSGQKKRWHRQKSLAHYYSKKVVDAEPKTPASKRKVPTAEKPIPVSPASTTIRVKLTDKIDDLKKKRSKESIAQKKLFQSVLNNNVSPLKKDLYKKKPAKHVAALQDFLNEEAVPIPHKQACTSIPKKILPKNLVRMHKDFIQKHPQHKISIRTMYRHKPKNIVTHTHAKFRQCLCEICTNVDLKLEALNKICSGCDCGKDVLSERSVCKNVSLECLDRLCECCGVQQAMASLGIPNNEMNVKWKSWDMVEKDNGKRRELVVKEGVVGELLRALADDLKMLPKHIHTFRFQFIQFRTLKCNLPRDRALAIFDFSENYLCSYQDEVQSAHWAYRQITVHPCCLYYACPSCEEQITDYLVVLSDDLNHDAHFVRKTSNIVQDHLHKANKSLAKVVIFSDGCSAQYKSRMPFFFLAKDKGPLEVERSYFGSRHGKSPCDSCGGTVKRLAARDVANGLATIQNAAAMNDHMTIHHSLPKENRDAPCCHTKRSYVVIDNVDRALESNKVKTVVGTQKLHQIKRLNSCTLLKRNLSCFCPGCLYGGSCENSQLVLPWESITIPDIMDFTLENLSRIEERPAFFASLQQELLSIDSESYEKFHQLAQATSNLLLKFPLNYTLRYLEEEQCLVDSSAIVLYPSLLHESCLPVVIGADGNCLPRSLSFLIFGNESYHVEMRCRLTLALSCNFHIFLDSGVWSLDTDPSDVLDFICQISQFGPSQDKRKVLEKETMLAIQDGSFMGLWQMFAAAFVLQCPVQCLYPDKGWTLYKEFCQRLICPPNASPDHASLKILWSAVRSDMSDEHWVPNHFVPVLPVTRPKNVEVITLSASLKGKDSGLSVVIPDSGQPLEPAVNSFYRVNWGGGVFVAQVTELSSSDQSACIRFMEEKRNLFCWPQKEDISWEPFSIFLQEVVLTLDEAASSQRKQWYSCSAFS